VSGINGSGLEITVVHFPSGMSKWRSEWNRSEHLLEAASAGLRRDWTTGRMSDQGEIRG